MTTGDIFVWVGNSGKTADVDGNTAGAVTGGSGGVHWLSTDNYYGLTANWRKKSYGGSTYGVFYHTTTTLPTGLDSVLLEHIPGNPDERENGDTADWPLSELLYGGVSGGTSGWYGTIGTGDGGLTANLVSFEVSNSYFNGGSTGNNYWWNAPYEKRRLGTQRLYNPVGYYKGLNLYIDTLTINSEPIDNALAAETRVHLSGEDSKINNININGVGRFKVKASYCESILLQGSAWDTDNFVDKSMFYHHTGNVGSAAVGGLIKVACESLDNFWWNPAYGSTGSQNCDVVVAVKRMPSEEGVVNINGPFGELLAYPWENYPSGYTGNAKIAINANSSTGMTFGNVKLKEYNPYHGVLYSVSSENLAVGFNNRLATSDTISNLEIEAGRFETNNLYSKLQIITGEINEEGILDLRGRQVGGSVEVAGMSGGHAGAGILNASGNSTLLLPDGVNFAFRVIDGGQTASARSSYQLNAQQGRR